MKHAVILAHPDPKSLSAAMAHAYVTSAEALGEGVILRDLYAIGFDPCLKAAEIPGRDGFQASPDVQAERQLLADADVFAFVYPLWFNAPPAILKGYVDRVFSAGFGYAPIAGGTEPLLDGKRLISFSFSGAPDDWVRNTGALQALQLLFDRHLAAMCGLQVLDHLHFGGIVPGIRDDVVDAMLQTVRRTVSEMARATANAI